LRCPFCGEEGNRVIDTRLAGDGDEIRRRRECDECGRRFTTRERVEVVLPRILKRDERREEFERKKLLTGIERACEKRPVSAEAVERLVARIERRLAELGEKEVSSRYVGERAMEELTALDALAAVRFASVFHDFQSTREYAEFFASLASEKTPGESEEDG
jgi:transcriptional repressor NrdR